LAQASPTSHVLASAVIVASRPVRGAVVQSRQCSQFGSALQTARHRLLAHPHRPRHGVGRRLVEIGQNYAGALDTVGRFRARSSDLNQRPALIRVHRQGNDPSCSDHGFSPAMQAAYHISQRSNNHLQQIDTLESFY
jgi:hypothetical protein